MLIALIETVTKKSRYTYPHTGLGYIAAVLERDGNEVVILDMDFHREQSNINRLSSEIDVVGVSATSFTFRQCLDILSRVKSINRETITIMGGAHTIIAMQDILQHEQVDYVIYGEGELTSTNLTRVLRENLRPKRRELANINGLIFRDNGEIVINPPQLRIKDLNKVPFPAFHLWDMKNYPAYPLITSRGCPYNCVFCSASVIWGATWLPRSPSNIIEEIKHAQKYYYAKYKLFVVEDDSFNISIPRALEFCEQLIKNKIKIEWACTGIRANLITFELAESMKRAGCVSVNVGIESADPAILKNINKGETLEEITKGINILSKAGIPVSASFVIGNPGDNLETTKRTMEFIKTTPLVNSTFYLAVPYPKTKLWAYIEKHGRFLGDDYTEFHHMKEKPSFDTPEFSFADRQIAYKLTKKFASRRRLRNLFKIFLLNVRGASPRKMVSFSRMAKRVLARELKILFRKDKA